MTRKSPSPAPTGGGTALASQEPRRTVEQAPAKLNLWLRVLSRRPDGLHELDSMAEPLGWGDHVEVTLWPRDGSEAPGAPVVSCRCPGHPSLVGPANLAFRAAEKALALLDAPPACEITVHKKIPLGAGLGGGSADAAATLRALHRLLGPALPIPAVEALARGLGADVPFCLWSHAARVQGWGERLTRARLPPHWLCLVYPGVPLATAEVFSRLDALPFKGSTPEVAPEVAPASQHHPQPVLSSLSGELPETLPLEALLDVTLTELIPQVCNDLLPTALAIDRRVGDALAALKAQGGQAASMTGSGSCLFSIHETQARAEASAEALSHKGYMAWVTAPLPENPRLWPPG